jgi:hypothetical protein
MSGHERHQTQPHQTFPGLGQQVTPLQCSSGTGIAQQAHSIAKQRLVKQQQQQQQQEFEHGVYVEGLSRADDGISNDSMRISTSLRRKNAGVLGSLYTAILNLLRMPYALPPQLSQSVRHA